MEIKVTNISLNNIQEYNSKDTSLINSIKLQRKFGLPEDYVELHIYDLNKNLLKSNYNFIGYKSLLASLPNSNNLITDLSVDPSKDSSEMGYDYGSIITLYNVLRNLFGSNSKSKFYIKTISTDRTELRIANNDISNDNLETYYNNFLLSFNAEAYYKDFYLNLENDRILIGINIALEKDPNQYNLLIKLYEPLPVDITLKDQFWLVDKLSDPTSYQVDYPVQNQEGINSNSYIKGPNFDIKINEQINPSIDYVNYDSFFSTTSTSSYQQIKSLLDEKSLDINVDYTDYSEFIHFSSAKERLLNFTYKLKLIEGYKSDLNTLQTAISTPQISSSKAIISNNINNIIEKFDGYEYYLYYESGSKAWPKKNSTKPYVNYELTSSAGLVWLGEDNDESPYYGGQAYSASLYDNTNQDNLFYSIPEYLRIDVQNQGYETFVYMIGQHFDNIWLYSKGITDLYDAQNNLYKGISKDLVAYALKSMGIKLYTNTSTTSDIFSYLIGVTPSGSYLPSTGSEQITTFVSASNTSLMGSEIDKEIYKRLYHNLPYLLKTKGTERGLRALISCYGIPDTILRINEFGGTDKDSSNFEQYFDRLSYALNTKTGSVYVTTPWAPSYLQSLSSSTGNIVPDTIEFRFKTNGVPTDQTFISQSLYQIGSGSNTQFGVQLIYPSQSSTGSYSEYGNMRLVMSGSNGYLYSNAIYLPFFNSDWWNVMILRETGSVVSSSITTNNRYWVYAANSIYAGHDGETIGFIGSSSLYITGSTSSSYNRAWNYFDTSSDTAFLGGQDSSNRIASGSTRFSGFFQELRYWITPLPVDNFIGHTLSPMSIESINETSSYEKLIFRMALGTDLNVSTSAIIPSIHPSYRLNTGSFKLGSGTGSIGTIISPGQSLYGVAVYGQDVYFGAGSDIVYTSNNEFYYVKSGNLGLGKAVNDKIRISSQNVISGSTLSPYVRIDQDPEVELTKDVNGLEIAFSPQDQINNDIIYQLGYFDIDNYVGDPRENTSNSYSTLNNLRDFYFKKYYNSYNLFDFIRLIKYYNNSLFKMIKDFIPGRANISTGIIIKPHILEKSKIGRHEPIVLYNGYSQSIDIIDVTGSDGGGGYSSEQRYAFIDYFPSVSGSVRKIQNRKWESYNGEFSGSRHVVTDQSLQCGNIYLSRSGSFSTNTFNHSNFNVLLNNVSQSRISNRYYDIDYDSNSIIATNLNNVISGSSLTFASVQDSNYTLTRHINPRYVGSRNISQLYNTYTEGDISYGKTAVIDKQVRKLGLFTSISSSLFFPNKSEVSIKYLVDEFGGLTELNIINNNWFEVQNTFKAAEILTVGQFDPLKFSNQRRLNGDKIIYNSGYSYLPILYFSDSDDNILFTTVVGGTKYFEVSNTNKLFLTSSTSTASLYRTIIEDAGGNWTSSDSPITQWYNVPTNGQYSFQSILEVSGSNFWEVLQYDIFIPTTTTTTTTTTAAPTTTTTTTTTIAPSIFTGGAEYGHDAFRVTYWTVDVDGPMGAILTIDLSTSVGASYFGGTYPSLPFDIEITAHPTTFEAYVRTGPNPDDTGTITLEISATTIGSVGFPGTIDLFGYTI